MSNIQTLDTTPATAAVPAKQVQPAEGNGHAVPDSDNEAITYDPVPLRLEGTVTARLKPIGKLPVVPWPEGE